jgi:hydroxyisourate hydrolase
VEVADTDLQISHERRITVAEAPGQPTISTHVLDTERGQPAEGVRVTHYRLDVGDAPIRMTQALTDADGRVRDLLQRPLLAGGYRLEFELGAADEGSFFRRLAVDLAIEDTQRSYHVPLLVAPFSMTTYRGS